MTKEIGAKKFQDIYREEIGKSPILQMGETALFSSDYVEWLQNKLWMQSQSWQQKGLTLEQCKNKITQEYGLGQFYVLMKGSSEERINEAIQKVFELYFQSNTQKWTDADMKQERLKGITEGFNAARETISIEILTDKTGLELNRYPSVLNYLNEKA